MVAGLLTGPLLTLQGSGMQPGIECVCVFCENAEMLQLLTVPVSSSLCPCSGASVLHVNVMVYSPDK